MFRARCPLLLALLRDLEALALRAAWSWMSGITALAMSKAKSVSMSLGMGVRVSVRVGVRISARVVEDFMVGGWAGLLGWVVARKDEAGGKSSKQE